MDYFETCSKKGRGMAQRSLELIEAMCAVTRDAHPITGRGVGYKLFTRGLIGSMAKSEMQRVYRLLREARERGQIPWEWIVDETRAFERRATWDDPAHYAECVARSYRRDFWNQQPVRVEVWSEKGPCVVCLRRSSIATLSASACCTDLTARRRSTTLRRMATAAN